MDLQTSIRALIASYFTGGPKAKPMAEAVAELVAPVEAAVRVVVDELGAHEGHDLTRGEAQALLAKTLRGLQGYKAGEDALRRAWQRAEQAEADRAALTEHLRIADAAIAERVAERDKLAKALDLARSELAIILGITPDFDGVDADDESVAAEEYTQCFDVAQKIARRAIRDVDKARGAVVRADQAAHLVVPAGAGDAAARLKPGQITVVAMACPHCTRSKAESWHLVCPGCWQRLGDLTRDHLQRVHRVAMDSPPGSAARVEHQAACKAALETLDRLDAAWAAEQARIAAEGT